MQNVNNNILTSCRHFEKRCVCCRPLGSTAGAIGAIAGGTLNVLGSEMKLNITNQNEKANLKFIKCTTIAISTVIQLTPSEELKGSISLNNSLKSCI